MASVNKVILVGNVGRDPEIRYAQGGDPIVNFSIATNEAWTDKSGQKPRLVHRLERAAEQQHGHVLRLGIAPDEPRQLVAVHLRQRGARDQKGETHWQ